MTILLAYVDMNLDSEPTLHLYVLLHTVFICTPTYCVYMYSYILCIYVLLHTVYICTPTYSVFGGEAAKPMFSSLVWPTQDKSIIHELDGGFAYVDNKLTASQSKPLLSVWDNKL